MATKGTITAMVTVTGMITVDITIMDLVEATAMRDTATKI